MEQCNLEDTAYKADFVSGTALSQMADALGTIPHMFRGFRAKVKILILVAIVCLSVAATAAIIVTANLRHVQIIENGTLKSITTFSNDPKLILEKNGMEFSRYDKVVFSGYKNNAGTITIYPAFKVTVTADNKTVSIMIASGTTADALKEAGVTVNSDDIVSSPLDSALQADENIIVKRVTYTTKINFKPVSFSTQTETTPLLSKSVQKLLREGRDGQTTVQTKVEYIDGSESGTTIVSETLSTKPISRQVLKGTAASTPVSSFNFSNLKLDANGVPLSYSRCITGIATAYTARSGARTSSGRRAGVGYVAVNPNVIPYGTKLYIMTPGGSFVYGEAVAADTGAFVHDGSGVLSDLYFASMNDCRRFAERTINIYVLK
jgi:uncharacterized protein YabE (DUF348 family)/3D (Asp-Asp-Asp) domain-containing protein